MRTTYAAFLAGLLLVVTCVDAGEPVSDSVKGGCVAANALKDVTEAMDNDAMEKTGPLFMRAMVSTSDGILNLVGQTLAQAMVTYGKSGTVDDLKRIGEGFDAYITTCRKLMGQASESKLDETQVAWLEEAWVLWDELQQLRVNREFLTCGYAPACIGARWAAKVKDLQDRVTPDFFLTYGFHPNDLWTLGMDYMEGRPGNITLEKRVRDGLGARLTGSGN